MRLAYVNAGGGAAASESFGALKAMHAAGFRPDKIFGSSAGALNAFGYSVGNIDLLEELWRSVKSVDDLFTSNWWIKVPWKSGLRYPDPLRKLLKELYLSQPLATIPFDVVVTELYSRQVLYVPHTDADILEMTIASARIPGYVELYEKNGSAYCDGGVTVNLPLQQAIAEKFDVIVCFHCTPRDQSKGDMWEPGNGVVNALRAYDITAGINYLAERALPFILPNPNTKIFDIYAAENDINTLDFHPDVISLGIARGQSNANLVIPQIRAALAAVRL